MLCLLTGIFSLAYLLILSSFFTFFLIVQPLLRGLPEILPTSTICIVVFLVLLLLRLSVGCHGREWEEIPEQTQSIITPALFVISFTSLVARVYYLFFFKEESHYDVFFTPFILIFTISTIYLLFVLPSDLKFNFKPKRSSHIIMFIVLFLAMLHVLGIIFSIFINSEHKQAALINTYQIGISLIFGSSSTEIFVILWSDNEKVNDELESIKVVTPPIQSASKPCQKMMVTTQTDSPDTKETGISPIEELQNSEPMILVQCDCPHPLCHLCCNQFNKDDRIPRILTKCGHSVCEQCVQELSDVDQLIGCPFCWKITGGPLNINRALMAII